MDKYPLTSASTQTAKSAAGYAKRYVFFNHGV